MGAGIAWQTTVTSCHQPRHLLFGSFGSVFAARTTARDQSLSQHLLCSASYAAPPSQLQLRWRSTCLATHTLQHVDCCTFSARSLCWTIFAGRLCQTPRRTSFAQDLSHRFILAGPFSRTILARPICWTYLLELYCAGPLSRDLSRGHLSWSSLARLT